MTKKVTAGKISAVFVSTKINRYGKEINIKNLE